MLYFFMGAILWCLAGSVPAEITWRKEFNEPVPLALCFLAALGGPITGLTTIVLYLVCKEN